MSVVLWIVPYLALGAFVFGAVMGFSDATEGEDDDLSFIVTVGLLCLFWPLGFVMVMGSTLGALLRSDPTEKDEDE